MYEHILVQPQTIELSCEPWYNSGLFREHHWVRHAHYQRINEAYQHHTVLRRNAVTSALSLRLTCRQMSREAAAIFYGKNGFRFTSGIGRQIMAW